MATSTNFSTALSSPDSLSVLARFDSGSGVSTVIGDTGRRIVGLAYEVPKVTATLSGTVTDDGMPLGASVTSSWTKVSGPGPVTFANPSSPATTATFSTAGQYVLRLTASDTEYSTNQGIKITVATPNVAPRVNAGQDQTVVSPATANLVGSVVDDGLPQGGQLATAWTKVSGPGTVTFANPNSETTTASFSQPGSYVLRLTAIDSLLTGSDDVTVAVQAAISNQPPTVSAGENQTITIPAAANLNGYVVDDGNPIGGSLTSRWTQVSTTSSLMNPTWYRLLPTGALPEKRVSHSVAYRPSTNRLMVFGGYFYYSPSSNPPDKQFGNDLWVLENANGLGGDPRWVELLPNDTVGAPSRRASQGAVYDAVANKLIMFGGSPPGSSDNLNDLWQLSNADGSSGLPQWTRVSPLGDLPAPRREFFAGYDPVNSRMIIYGGLGNGAIFPSTVLPITHDVWVLANANASAGTPTWIKLTVPPGPVARVRAYVAYDPFSNRLIVFGGSDVNQNPLNDTWLLTNANGLGGPPQWIQVTTAHTPGARNTGLAFYDRVANQMVIIGGCSAGFYCPEPSKDEMWVLKNANGLGGPSDWTLVPTAGSVHKQFTSQMSATHDEINNRFINFGNAPSSGSPADPCCAATNETWILNAPTTRPATASFVNALAPVTTASFTAPGVYQLRLTANDSLLTSSADTSVTALAANGRPFVDAGPNQTISLGSAASLNGTVYDDGLPLAAAINTAWTMLSGPGSVSFSNATATSTSATFTQAGSYVLRLTANDTLLSGSGQLTVVVSPPVGPSISSVAPNIGAQGQSLSVQVTGQSTHFAQGVTQVDFGAGINVNSLSVSNALSLTASLTIASNATIGPRTITLQTGSEQFALPNGFNVLVGNQQPLVSAGTPQAVPLQFDVFVANYASPNPGGGGVIRYDGSSGAAYEEMIPPGAGTHVPVLPKFGPDKKLYLLDQLRAPGDNIGQAGLVRFDADTGQFLGIVVPYGSGGLTDCNSFLFMPDGSILINDQRAMHVKRFDGTTGAYLGVFAAPPPGITSIAGGWMSFGPDGHLYVGYGTNILRYNGVTGAFISVFVPAGSGGIQQPGNPVFRGPYLYVTSFPDGALLRFNAITGAFIDVFIPNPGSVSHFIDFGSDGRIWIARGTSGVRGEIQRFDATTGAFVDRFVASGTGGLWTPVGFAFRNKARSFLAGTVSDDGLPAGSVLTTNWSVVSAPGEVAFDIPQKALANTAGAIYPVTTDVSLGPVGTYILRLSATDSLLSAASDVTLNVVATSNSSPSLNPPQPSSGTQGQSLAIVVSGLNTHFVQGTTQVSFGAGIIVTNVTVTSSTSLTAQVTIAPSAATGLRDISVTTNSEAVTRLGTFVVNAASATPLLTGVLPTSGQQGQSGPLTITGQNTHFLQGTTQLNLGPGITVNSLSVTCATCLSAQISIAPDAAPGPRTVIVTTGGEIAQLIGGFNVTAGTPILTSLFPASGRQGQQLTATVTGQFTHFLQGTTQVSFGAGVSVSLINVTSPTSLTAQLAIDSTAALGSRTITVTTNGEVVSAPNIFNVLAGVPVLTAVAPFSALQGQSVTISVAGQFTHFVQGATQVALGPDVAISAITVTSPTVLSAQLTIAANAAAGPRTLTVTTGTEVVTLLNAFSIGTAPIPFLSLVSPGGATQGQTIAISLTAENTHFVQGSTQANFGAGVTVGGGPPGGYGPVVVISPTQATAQVAVSLAAPAGFRTVALQTGGEQISFPNGFTILAATNQAPNVSAGQNQTIALPASATLSGSSSDDGLPTGASVTVTWSKISGPGVVTFANPNAANTTASFSLPGTYVLRLTATDTQLSANSDVSVIVRPANQAPTISIAPSWSVALPARLLLTYAVTDDGLPAGGALTVSWDKISGPGNHGFQSQTPTSISVGFDQPGVYVLRLTATDAQFTVTQDISVTASGTPLAPPTVSLASPLDGAEITTRADVMGSVNSASLESWTLEFRMAEETAYRTLATGTTNIASAKLGTFDPTALLNGIAQLRLRAKDTNGGTAITGDVSLILTKNQKIGNFTVSFNDMTVPMPGLPIQIVRTYDSRNRAPGDFGYGWTLDIKTVRINENIIPGRLWTGTVNTSFPRTYCVQLARSHIVTVTLPDNTTYKFQPTLTPQCQQVSPATQVAMGFSPMPGTNASLAIVGNNAAQFAGSFPGNGDLVDFDTLAPFDPNRYQLTLPDGRVLILDQSKGLESMTDLSGNKLTVTSTGIQHTSGKSIVFTRDSATQNISKITDPAGNFVSYAYNVVTGDLTAATDRENLKTEFTYDATHGLLSIKDPRGIQPIRNEYDSAGRLIRHIDAFGNAINYTHSFATNQEIVTDRLGNVTVNEYDADGNVVKVTDPLGAVTVRSYDSRGNTLTETNPLGKTRTFTYDANDNRLTETDPLANTTTYTYNSRKQALTITDALGRVTTNTYDASGNLTSTRDALGQTTTYTYDSRGLPLTVTDPLSNIARSVYDASGNLTQQTDPLGNITSYTYDVNGNKLSDTRSRTAPSGPETLVTSYQYNKSNQSIRTTLPDGSFTQTLYNSIGKQSATIDQLGRQTTYTYDSMGRLARTDFPDGTNEQSTYDAEGRRLTSIDRGGRTTSYLYDKLGRLTRTTFPDTATSSTVYDTAGQVTQTTDARGNSTSYAYDDGGRRTRVTNALNQATNFEYDKLGNQIAVTDARGNRTQYAYDALNRRIVVTHPDNSTDLVGYDALGRTLSKTDQAGKTTQFGYDRLGRLLRVTDALNQVTSYGYDELGNRISQMDAKGRVTRFEYDKLGRRIKRTLPLGQSEGMTYDVVGNLKTKTDFNGRITTYAYDAANRLLSKTPDPFFAAPLIVFTYSTTGQRLSMSDPSGVTTYTYDARDRLTRKATPQGALSYTWDLQGNLTSIRSSNIGGTSVDYAYDTLNRLSQVTDNRLTPNGITTYSYDAAGNLEAYTYPNGVRTAHTYSQLNRLTSLTSAKGASTLSSYAYTLGQAGNRTKVSELGGRTVDYAYDSLYRLSNETISGSTTSGAIGYTYDQVGNRLTRTSTVTPVPAATYSYDDNDRLAPDSYDANGNTTAASGGTNFIYDFENHLKAKNGTEVTIIYDGDGNRVSKAVGGVTTSYLVDDRSLTGYAQVLEELTGTVQRIYTYGLNRISQSQASGTNFYGYDGHGSVRLLTDATGAATDRYDHDAFGTVIQSTGSTSNDYRYAGEQADPNLGMLYLRARYLATTVGRFWTLDSFEGTTVDPRSQHGYLYASANPVSNIDPAGHFSLPVVSLTLAVFSQLSVFPAIQPPNPILSAGSELLAMQHCGCQWRPRPERAADWKNTQVFTAEGDANNYLQTSGYHETPDFAGGGWTRPHTYHSWICGTNTYRDHAYVRRDHPSVGLFSIREQIYDKAIAPGGEPNPEVWASGPWPYYAWPFYVEWWHATR